MNNNLLNNSTYRLAKIQLFMGMPLPEGTRYKMTGEVYKAALPAYEELMNESAKAELLLADDTWIKILEWLHEHNPSDPKLSHNFKKPPQ